MSVELTFGGPKAWAYQQLSSTLEYKVNLIVGVGTRKSFLLPTIKHERDDQPYLIVDNKFIDMANVEFISKKVKRLGKTKAIDLLLMFGTVDKIREADISELIQIKGIGNNLAHRIKKAL